MEVENTLAKNITAAGEKAAYDAACKKLLANILKGIHRLEKSQ